jgi:hypothetical protein
VLSDSGRSGHPVDDCRAVVGVAAVAAVASYEHAYALVRAHGEDFRSSGPPSARARKWPSLLTSQSTRPRRGGGDVHQLTACTGLRPSGQADLRALNLLRPAIAALPPDAGEIHLQLASLEYIDVAATPELVMLTTRPSRLHPVLHYPPLVMLRLLQLCSPEARSRFSIGAVRPDRNGAVLPTRVSVARGDAVAACVKRRAHEGASLQGRGGKVPPRPCPREDEDAVAACYAAFRPPSTSRTAPWTKLASSPAR